MRPRRSSRKWCRLLPRFLLKPRNQLFQIDTVEADVLVTPGLVEIEKALVHLPRIVSREVLVERLGEAVVPALGELCLDLRIVFLGIVDFMTDEGLLEILAPVNHLELLPAELKRFRLGRDIRGQFLLLGGFLLFLRLALGLEDCVE